MAFTKAVRQQSRLRLALTGPSGSGKTYSALLLAQGLGGKIAMIDTEHGSASLYSHLVEFDTMALAAPYSPERYVAAIKEAEQGGYGVLIIDSITHEWNGNGGMLQINQRIADTEFRGNTWSAWSKTDPRHRAFVDSILQSPMHVIVTMRSKTETAQEKDDRGKTKIVQLGMKAEQRDGIVYEFTTVLDLVHGSNYATATKDRTGVFAEPHLISPATGEAMRKWLETGVEAEPVPAGDASAVAEVKPRTSIKSVAADTWEKFSEDEQMQLNLLASVVIDRLKKDDDFDAFTALQEAELSADHRVAIWSRFSSTERARLKAQSKLSEGKQTVSA